MTQRSWGCGWELRAADVWGKQAVSGRAGPWADLKEWQQRPPAQTGERVSKGFRREMSERNGGPGKLRQMTSVMACDPLQSRPQGQDWATGWGPAPGGHCGQFSEQSFIVRNQLCGGFDFPPECLPVYIGDVVGCPGPRPLRKAGGCRGRAAAQAGLLRGTSSRRESRRPQAFHVEDGGGTLSVAAAHDSVARGRK